MAADTALKRYSAMNIGCPWRGILPIPDATTSAADRAVVVFLYSGIAGGAAVSTGGSGGYGGSDRRRRERERLRARLRALRRREAEAESERQEARERREEAEKQRKPRKVFRPKALSPEESALLLLVQEYLDQDQALRTELTGIATEIALLQARDQLLEAMQRDEEEALLLLMVQ